MNKFAMMFKQVAMKQAEAMARTFQEDPLQSYMFKVTIAGLPTGVGFQKVSGLSREVEVIEYLENMYSHTHKLAGRETVGEITLERGCYADGYLQAQYESIFKSNAKRSTVTIDITDKQGNVRRSFTLAECWFSKFELGDLDATSSDVIIETLTMQAEYFI